MDNEENGRYYEDLIFEEDGENNESYEEFRIRDGNSYNCILCGKLAQYMRYGYTWCEKHKEYLDREPEDLEEMINEKYEVAEIDPDEPGIKINNIEP